MWQSLWTCVVDPRHCYPVARLRERHPITDSEPPPNCTDHQQPMRLAHYRTVESQIKPHRIRRRTRKRFNAEQLNLIGF